MGFWEVFIFDDIIVLGGLDIRLKVGFDCCFIFLKKK